MGTYTVTGLYLDNSPFTFSGTVTIVGHVAGDANGDFRVDVGDAVFLICHIFNSGPGCSSTELCDTNGDCVSNVGDAVYLINYVFKGGPAPVEGCGR